MSSPEEFTAALQAAIDAKTVYFDTSVLPELLENFRLLHTCVKTLFDVLDRYKLIVPDPYKLDKKTTSITSPENGPFAEPDSAKVIGQRMSDYESVLDYVATYYKFTTENINVVELKKLNDLMSSFLWDNMTSNSVKPNTSSMASLLANARKQSTGITISNITDAMNRSSQATRNINSMLREVSEFVREKYKLDIRVKVIGSSKFDKTKGMSSVDAEFNEIKRLYPELMGKKGFYKDLVREIALEDLGPDSETIRADILKELSAIQPQKQEKKEETVDTKAMILASVFAMSGTAPQYESVMEKLDNNNRVINTVKKTIWTTLAESIRKMLGLPHKQVEYLLTIVDQKTNTKKTRKIEFSSFMQNLKKRTNLYAAFGSDQTPEYDKLLSIEEESIANFVMKHIHENQEIFVLLNALDNFFKANVAQENRSKIKGLSMELTSLKNCIVKANQRRVDYLSYKEEEAQLKKMGI